MTPGGGERSTLNLLEEGQMNGAEKGADAPDPYIPLGCRSRQQSGCKMNKQDSETVEESDCRRVDTLFYRICWLTLALGVNFYKRREWWKKAISAIVVTANIVICLYFILYVAYYTAIEPFNADALATNLGLITYTMQSMISVIFLAHWQSAGMCCKALRQLYSANKGRGIQKFRSELVGIVRHFYLVIGAIVIFTALMAVCSLDEGEGGMNKINLHASLASSKIPEMFGSRKLFCIFIWSTMYCELCWAADLFIYSLLVHAAHCEFLYYNDQIKELRHDAAICSDDEYLCEEILALMKVHNRLTESVKQLDKMFNKYAFVMIATIIPTTIFALIMLFRGGEASIAQRVPDLLFSLPIVCICIFSFITLTNSPSRLHDAIYSTKSALCANTHIWFPYRSNVYHSALAFVCHVDQANLGISIWGFAVVSKPLILTTLSVMVTCLALFLQLGECKAPLTGGVSTF